MTPVNTAEAMAELVQANSAVLILFGGASCGVCQAIKPQLERLARDEFPELVTSINNSCLRVAGQIPVIPGKRPLPLAPLYLCWCY